MQPNLPFLNNQQDSQQPNSEEQETPQTDVTVEEITPNIVISPAKFDIFLKLLTDICDTNDPVIIKNSEIIRRLANGALVKVNVQDIFDKNIDLHIVNPQKYIKLFKQFKNNNDIEIILDNTNSRYVVTNGEIRIFFPKIDESLEDSFEMPDLSNNITNLDIIDIDNVTRNLILNLAKDSKYIEIMFKNNKAKGIHIPETAVYIFQQYMNEPNIKQLDETTADLCLRSTAFLPINNAESFKVHICEKTDEQLHFFYTLAKFGTLEIAIYEEVVNSSGGLLF